MPNASAFRSLRRIAGLLCLSLLLPAQAAEPLFSAEQLTQLETYRSQYTAVKNQAQLLALYRQAQQLKEQLDKAVEPLIEARYANDNMPTEQELQQLAALTPGLHPAMVAEGTQLAFQEDYQAFASLAAATPENGDDAYFALMQQAYGPVYHYFGNWFMQTWDYGGCTQLGSGSHLQLFKQIQELRQSQNPFAPELSALENTLFRDLESGNNFCLPQPQVLNELRQLLPLMTDSYRPQLEQRIQQLQAPNKAHGFNCGQQPENCNYG